MSPLTFQNRMNRQGGVDGTQADELHHREIQQQVGHDSVRTGMAGGDRQDASRVKEAGALRQVVTQIWNQEGSFILGSLWEYTDESAFIACQELFREAEAAHSESTGVSSIIVPSRGVTLHDTRL